MAQRYTGGSETNAMSLTEIYTSTPKITNPFISLQEDESQSHGAFHERLQHESTPQRSRNPFHSDSNPRQPPTTEDLFHNEGLNGNSGLFYDEISERIQSQRNENNGRQQNTQQQRSRNSFRSDVNPLQSQSTTNPFYNDGFHGNSRVFTISQTSKKIRKPVKIPDDFDGRSSLRDYLIHFNRCSIVNDWSDEESAIFLSASLRGEAQKLLHGMPEDDCRNYHKLVARLESCFGVETQRELHQARLNNRRQQEGESLKSLAVDIRDMCSLAYQDLPLAAQERFCVQHFIEAINDREDRMKLRRDKPRKLDIALASARELAAFKQMENNLRRPDTKFIRTGKVELSKESEFTTTQEAQQDLQEKFDELKRQQEAQFKNLSQQIQQLLKGSNGDKQDSVSQPPRNRPQSQTGRQSPKDPIECWYCKEKGHLRRDCSLWNKNQGNEKRAPSNAQRSA